MFGLEANFVINQAGRPYPTLPVWPVVEQTWCLRVMKVTVGRGQAVRMAWR